MDYPVNLKIQNRKCVVIGGGTVAERKVLSLLACGAAVTVISPELTTALRQLAKDGTLIHIARPYQAGDAGDFFIAVCATNNLQVNALVFREAEESGTLVNVVDDPQLCSFTLPAQVARGDLLLTVSTGGKSPALAKLLCEELAETYGEEYGLYLDFLADLREKMKKMLGNPVQRKLFWQQALHKEVLNLLRQGKFREAEAEITDAVNCIRVKS